MKTSIQEFSDILIRFEIIKEDKLDEFNKWKKIYEMVEQNHIRSAYIDSQKNSLLNTGLNSMEYFEQTFNQNK